jgi:hypothetical protein
MNNNTLARIHAEKALEIAQAQQLALMAHNKYDSRKYGIESGWT